MRPCNGEVGDVELDKFAHNPEHLRAARGGEGKWEEGKRGAGGAG